GMDMLSSPLISMNGGCPLMLVIGFTFLLLIQSVRCMKDVNLFLEDNPQSFRRSPVPCRLITLSVFILPVCKKEVLCGVCCMRDQKIICVFTPSDFDRVKVEAANR